MTRLTASGTLGYAMHLFQHQRWRKQAEQPGVERAHAVYRRADCENTQRCEFLTSLERSKWPLTFDKQIDELAGDLFAAKNEAEKKREKQKWEQNTMCCGDCVKLPTAPLAATANNEEPRRLLSGIVFRPAAKWPADLEATEK